MEYTAHLTGWTRREAASQQPPGNQANRPVSLLVLSLAVFPGLLTQRRAHAAPVQRAGAGVGRQHLLRRQPVLGRQLRGDAQVNFLLHPARRLTGLRALALALI